MRHSGGRPQTAWRLRPARLPPVALGSFCVRLRLSVKGCPFLRLGFRFARRLGAGRGAWLCPSLMRAAAVWSRATTASGGAALRGRRRRRLPPRRRRRLEPTKDGLVVSFQRAGLSAGWLFGAHNGLGVFYDEWNGCVKTAVGGSGGLRQVARQSPMQYPIVLTAGRAACAAVNAAIARAAMASTVLFDFGRQHIQRHSRNQPNANRTASTATATAATTITAIARVALRRARGNKHKRAAPRNERAATNTNNDGGFPL